MQWDFRAADVLASGTPGGPHLDLGGKRAMKAVCFSPCDRELRVRLVGLTEDQAREEFRSLGRFLVQFSERRLACLGASILSAVAGTPHEEACRFCHLDKGRADKVTAAVGRNGRSRMDALSSRRG
jgi:hypothetical protein